MKEIQLTQNRVALVDDGDYDYLNQWKWYFSCGYAIHQNQYGTKKENIHMHRLVMNTSDGMDTDHINHNKLDNRKENLRISTRSQNSANRPKQANNKSGYKGVAWFKAGGLWTVRINVNGKLQYCKYFKDVVEAAHAYDTEAKRLFGDFAMLNFND